MKALSILLLLALGLGAGWWTVTHPGGTVEDARREALALAERLGGVAEAAKEDVVALVDPIVTAPDPVGAPEPVSEPEPERDAPLTAAGGDAAPGDDMAGAPASPGDGAGEVADGGVGSAGTPEGRDPLAVDDARPDADVARADADADVASLADGGDAPGEDPATAPSPLPESRTNVIQGRLTDAERRLDATAVREEATLERLDALEGRLRRLSERLDGGVPDREATASEGQASVSPPADAAAGLVARLDGLARRLEALETAGGAGGAAPEDAAQREIRTRLAALEARLRERPLPPATGGDGGAIDDPSLGQATSASPDATLEELRATQDERHVEYKIYFDRDSTTIGGAAARVLDSLIVQERNRTTGVSIYGFTDSQGSPQYNRRLALERAANVRDYLLGKGLPEEQIRTLSGLDAEAAAAILPEDAEAAQQRVVVLYAAQP